MKYVCLIFEIQHNKFVWCFSMGLKSEMKEKLCTDVNIRELQTALTNNYCALKGIH